MDECINVNSLRFGDLPVSWVIDEEGDRLLRVKGFNGYDEQLASVLRSGRWYAFRSTAPNKTWDPVGEGHADSVDEAKQAALRCLVDAEVLTVVGEQPVSASSMKFLRMKYDGVSHGILNLVNIECSDPFDGHVITLSMPAAQADTLVAFLRIFGFSASSYEV